MQEIDKNPDANERLEQKLEISDYHQIKPDGEITLKECKEFWDDLFGLEFSDGLINNNLKDHTNKNNVDEILEGEKPEKNGGCYGELCKKGEGGQYEVHHLPADSVSNLERKDGPAIKMEKEDHRQTASCGSSKEAREYRVMQKELIEQGKFREALYMDIDDIHEKFGDKYDEAIEEVLEYVDKLEEDGRIDG